MSRTRIAAPRVPSGSIELQAPPELSASEGASGLLMSMLPMVGAIGSIVMVTMTSSGIAGILTGGMFLMSSLGFVAVNGWRQSSQRNAQVLASRREYLAYLGELRSSVRAAAKQQRRHANWSNPAPETLPFVAEEGGRVWERSPNDADFLATRLGTTDQPLCVSLDVPELPPLAQLDPVSASAAHRFILTHETQRDLPFALPLGNFSRVELAGDEAEVRQLARAMLLNIATLHSPADVQIVIATDRQHLPEWEWAKWLPHTHSTVSADALGPARMIGGDLDQLVELLPAEVGQRTRFSPGERADRHVFVVTDGVSTSESRALASADGLQGVTVIDLPSSWGDLANSHTLRVAFGAGGDTKTASLVTLDHDAVDITPDVASVAIAEATARRLLPYYSGEGSGDDAAPVSTKQLELVELLGLPDVRDIDFDKVWANRPERDRLRVPIGQTSTGAPMVIDVKEPAQKGMGPHGVLIGATGSGKSEVLRTLVLALTLTHSPDQLNFVLVDFKGGATFTSMTETPHVSAVITNLGKELALVDRFQDALQGEVVRRQEVLREAGGFASVRDYEKARREDRPDLAPLPALLIIVDEFSELLAAKPEFIESFVNIGRVGRSLHIHLLVASQRLEEGKLRGLDTFLSYRIGLRTFSEAESRSIIGTPDAFHLPQEPGYGFLKSGSADMTQFRAAYVSGPPKGRRAVAQSGDGDGNQSQVIDIREFTSQFVEGDDADEAEAAPEDAAATPAETGDEKLSTFDLALARMHGIGPSAHRVWLPPLETPPTLDQLLPDLREDPELGLVSPGRRGAGRLTAPVGMVDIPLEQRRESLVLSLDGAAGHAAIVGGPRSGKSTLARTLLVSLSLGLSPQEAQFYVLDFGGGTFTGLRNFPHVAGVASRSEPDVVRRMVSEVNGIINAREDYFRDNGIDSIETYHRKRAQGAVDDGYGDVFLIVDGWGTLKSEFDEIETQMQSITARGLTYGVHVIVTAARWMEIRQSVKDLFGTRIELRLGDPSDSEVDRKAAANVTVGMPGRGLDARGLQMLTALPRIDGDTDADSLSEGIEQLVDRVASAYAGEPGPKLRLLPEQISLDEIRAHEQFDPSRVALGVDEDALAPYAIDLAEEPCLYVYGDSDSGKTTFLRSYVEEIARMYTPDTARVFVVDYRRKLLGDLPEDLVKATMSTHEEAAQGIEELVAFFRTRLPGKDVTPEQLRSRSWWDGPEGFIVVDDYDLVSTSQGNPLAPLVSLLPQAQDVGLRVVLARSSGGASRAAYDPVIQRMTDLGATGMVLSGNPEEGALIGKVKPTPAPAGRATVVSRERGVFRAQLAFSESRFGD